MARTYNPKDVSVSFNGNDITGFAEDEFINAEFNEDQASVVVGNDGTVSRAINPDKSATVTLTLKSTSPANDILSGLAITDRAAGNGIGVLMIKDNNGTTVAIGKDAWIQKEPALTFAREVGNRAWVFAVGTWLEFVGSNPES